ncbi:SHOCT domain-containing protein [Subtercola lobariae]|uniref:SHOCT domain-containing protein n=1 Tax=Subtercola lobariae TaxID=1588641 RepID=UPI00166E5E5C|nr:SHOCT domain-containing protein [Subtercola lobariae]
MAIWPDRIEWDRPRSASGGKMVLGAMTLGVSLAATGVSKNHSGGSEMIPIRSITSVSTARDGSNTIVQVLTAGGQIDFRVKHREATQVRAVLNDLILRGPEPVKVNVVATSPVVASLPPIDIPAQLKQLKTLYDDGVLTDDEFNTKKAELLARM